MSDLISRSRAIENIWDVFNSYANDSQRFDEYETEAINNAFTVLQKTIEGQPTAYDVEKVVGELKKRSNDVISNIFAYEEDDHTGIYNNGLADDYEYAIDIVKKGGVE